MKFILNVISLLAVGSGVAASEQQEVQHRLRGGVPASTKNVEERRLDDTDASSGDCASITDTVCAMEGVTVFCELLKNPKRRHLGVVDTNSTSTDEDEDDTDADTDTDAVAMASPTGASASSDGADFASAFGFEDESEEFTLFAPTDAAFAEIADAFETLSDAEAGRVIMFHMYSGMLLTSDKLACRETITSMNEMSDASRTKCNKNGDGKKYQNGNGNTKTGSMPEIDTADHMACNGVIHTLDHVMFPVSLAQLHAATSDASDSSDTGASTLDNDTADATDNSDADAEVIQTSPPTTNGNETSVPTAVDVSDVSIESTSLSKGTVDDGAPLDPSRLSYCKAGEFAKGSNDCAYVDTSLTDPVMKQTCICTYALLTECKIGSDQDSYC